VRELQKYGVISFDKKRYVKEIVEKPEEPASNYAVTGIYFYDNDFLDVRLLGRGNAWLDAGTHEYLLDATNSIKLVEDRHGLIILCLEEIAYRKGYISLEQVKRIAESFNQSGYAQYLLDLIRRENWQ